MMGGEQQDAAAEEPDAPSTFCAICHDEVTASDTLILPCAHSFCRGCIDTLFIRQSEYASRCPNCRAPLFGAAQKSFDQGFNWLSDDGECDAAVECFTAARDAAEPFATGPAGLNRLATAAQYNIGRAHETAGRLEPAAAAYRAAFTMSQQTDASAVSNEGTMRFRLGQNAAAMVCWESAIALDPGDILTHLNIGSAYLDMSSGDLAIVGAQAKVDLVIALDPHNAGAHNLQGVLMQRQGQINQARAAYSRALALNPDHPDFARNLAALGGLD